MNKLNIRIINSETNNSVIFSFENKYLQVKVILDWLWSGNEQFFFKVLQQFLGIHSNALLERENSELHFLSIMLGSVRD